MVSTAYAQTAREQWQALNEQMIGAYQQGDYATGIQSAEQARELALNSFGLKDADTLTSLDNLAFLYQIQGRYGEAEPLYAQVLALRREVLGERHPDTLNSLNNLAFLYQSQNRYGEAVPLYAQALALRQEVLGERHPDTLNSLNNLAFLYQSQGRYGEAEPLFEQALALRRAVLGERHPDTLTSLSILAELYQSQGRYGEAEPMFEQALAQRRVELGERHPDTMTSLNNLASSYQSLGRYGEAEQLFEQALALRRTVHGERHPATLLSLNNLASLYQKLGRYSEAEPLYEQALALRREVLSKRHPDTLTSLNDLASLYQNLGRNGEAEPLYEQALALRRAVLGDRHPDTLSTLSNLATLYQNQGRFSEAEPLYAQALAMSREVLGERHPDTLISLNNLAGLYQSQGRFGEAKPLYEQALALRREALGEHHPDTLSTLSTLNNLATLYQNQGRYSEAEPLFEQALAMSRIALGEHHPDTLSTLNNLATLYQDQSRFGEAEPLFEQALSLSRAGLGEHHPDTLGSLNNLAGWYQRQGRYGEAEPLYEQALALFREVLGERHPATLSSLNNLAGLYQSQRRYGEAEPLYEQALALRREVLGRRHPDTLDTLTNLADLLPVLDKPGDAARRLRELEPALLDRLAAELYRTEAVSVRRSLVASQSTFQNMVLSLAIAFPGETGAERVAALGVLHFKGLLAEEEAWMARLSRRSQDPRVQTAATELAVLRQQLAANYHGGIDPDVLKVLLRLVNQAELKLGRLSRDYADHLQVKSASVDDLQGKLPADSALVDYRRYHRRDFGRGYAEERWAAVVFEGLESIRVIDLGAIEQTTEEIRSVMENGASAEAAARRLHQRLIGQLDLPKRITRLYFAPDDVLHLLPFHRLIDEAGHYLGERFELRQLQSARDLLRVKPDQPAHGLLALGGINFDARLEESASPVSDSPKSIDNQMDALRSITAETFRDGFSALANTGPEVQTIEQLYRQARPEERTEIWQGDDATEERLKGLKVPPRVLHLATHGFYRAASDQTDRPMLLAGITLSGANRALSSDAEDGILYALEVQDLNLEGTELVVLSACETAQGEIAYGDGVYGLVRALRTAGARNVLVTLRPIGDASAPQFMKRFYTNWLSQLKGRSDPTQALQDTQAYYIKNEPTFDWLPYVIVGG